MRKLAFRPALLYSTRRISLSMHLPHIWAFIDPQELGCAINIANPNDSGRGRIKDSEGEQRLGPEKANAWRIQWSVRDICIPALTISLEYPIPG